MAKSNLPSIDSDYRQPQRQAMPTVSEEPRKSERVEDYTDDIRQYRSVDAKLKETAQRIKFRDIYRSLQDKGARLANGSFISSKVDVVRWLIENYKQ